jgi:hypothetical protein
MLIAAFRTFARSSGIQYYECYKWTWYNTFQVYFLGLHLLTISLGSQQMNTGLVDGLKSVIEKDLSRRELYPAEGFPRGKSHVSSGVGC